VRFGGDRLMVGFALVAALYLLLPPLLLTVYSALRTPANRLPFEEGTSWGLSNLTDLYTSGALLNTVVDTSVFVGGSVAVAMVVGFAIAWLVERTNLPFRNGVFVLVLFPLMMPGIVTTMGWLLLLTERTGMVNVALRAVLPVWDQGPFDVFSMYGMVVVQGVSLVALAFIFVSAGLRNMDPVLEDASRVSGASALATFRRITLPVLWPGVLGAALVTAILTVESFEVPLLLAGGANADIFSSRLYFALNDASGGAPAYGTVAALGLHFLVFTYALIFVYHRLTGRGERYVTLTGRGYHQRRQALGGWRWPVSAVVGGFLLLTSIGPFLVLVWTSLLPQYMPPGAAAFERLSFDQYTQLFSDGRLVSAWVNTVVVAVVAPTIAVFVTILLAWVVIRAKKMRRLPLLLDQFLTSSLAIPSVVAANAFLLFYLQLNRALPNWVPLFGTILVLVLVYAYRMAVAYRMNHAGVVQISVELEDASSASGASRATTFFRIVLPLALPSVVGVWVLLFLVAFRELTLPLVVGRESPPFVVSVLIWKLWAQHAGQAAALGVLTVVFLSSIVLGLRLLVFRRFR
jgi:iron(III) transport system permease protein